ncbi:hypothetical protein FXO37_21478 [Capsicum annuum]|nr:hypothetical protein FXO37_21478 [Capsicum annuum]
MHGGYTRGRGYGDAAVCREGHGHRCGRRHDILIHEGVGDPVDDPIGHYEPEPQAVADDNLVGHYEPVHSLPFHPSPLMLGCSSMLDLHNFSTYVAPSWVDEPN